MSDTDEEQPDEGPGPAPLGGAGGGGGTGFVHWLTGGTAFLKALAGFVGALAVLTGALAAAGVISGRGDDGGGGTTNGGGTTTEPSSGFSDPPDLFRTLTRPNGRAYFEDDALLVTALRPARPFVVPAEVEEQGDVEVHVAARRLSGSPDYGFGILCRYQSAGTYYLLAVLSGGRYNVVRYRGGEARSLTGMQTSSAIEGDAHELEARCVGDTTTILSLFVDGSRVARVEDTDAIETGGVGLRVGSGEARVTVQFERFVLDSL